jgi:hypothetical protein
MNNPSSTSSIYKINKDYGQEFFSKNISVISVFAFLVLYIICFVYLFIDENQSNSALILLTVFHLLFFMFVTQLFSRKITENLNSIMMTSWCSIFLACILQLVSLVLMLIGYKFFHDTYTSKGKKLQYTATMMKEMYDYNVLFISTVMIVIVFLLFLLFFQSYLNSKTLYFFTPIVIPVFITLVNITILVLPCFSIKIGNDYILLRNNDANYSNNTADFET